VPKERRASALAFYALGIPIGSLLGMIIGGQLSDALGWRQAFVVVGLPGILMAVIVWMVLREPRHHDAADAGSVAHAAPITNRDAIKSILGSRAMVLLLIAASSAAFLSYGKTTWATIFFQRTHDLSPGEVGLYFGVVNGIAGILGTWLGGRIADRWGATNRRHVLTSPAVGMAIAIPIAYLGYSAGDWRVALVLLFVPTALNSLYYGPVYSSVQGLVPLRSRAMASAVLLFFQNLIGLGFGPLLFGMLSDAIKPSFGEDSVQVVLYTATLLGLVPAFFFWRCSLRLNDELDRHT
jgi:MFS transporter, Spinster family, sphingosine-1-phosphate transporter